MNISIKISEVYTILQADPENIVLPYKLLLEKKNSEAVKAV